MKRKITAFLLILAMIAVLLPVATTAFADGGGCN